MGRRVVVVASGETERRSLLPLLATEASKIAILKSRHGSVTPDDAERLIRAAWGEGVGRGEKLDKAVVLVDADGRVPADALRPLQDRMAKLSKELGLPVKLAYAQWHLEAWFFADAAGLRRYFRGRALGRVDTSRPDEIQNPKQHLKMLLRERGHSVYTAIVSETIAKCLNPSVIAERSASFAAFVEAVRNGSKDRQEEVGPGEHRTAH